MMCHFVDRWNGTRMGDYFFLWSANSRLKGNTASMAQPFISKLLFIIQISIKDVYRNVLDLYWTYMHIYIYIYNVRAIYYPNLATAYIVYVTHWGDIYGDGVTYIEYMSLQQGSHCNFLFLQNVFQVFWNVLKWNRLICFWIDIYCLCVTLLSFLICPESNCT